METDNFKLTLAKPIGQMKLQYEDKIEVYSISKGRFSISLEDGVYLINFWAVAGYDAFFYKGEGEDEKEEFLSDGPVIEISGKVSQMPNWEQKLKINNSYEYGFMQLGVRC